MEHSPSWEANSRSAGQWISSNWTCYWTSSIHHPKIYRNDILPSPRYSNWTFSKRIEYRNFVWISCLPF